MGTSDPPVRAELQGHGSCPDCGHVFAVCTPRLCPACGYAVMTQAEYDERKHVPLVPTTAALTVPAVEVRPFDSIAEGTVVICKTWHQIERWDRLTGEVSWLPVVDIDCTPARTVIVETLPTGEHLHDIDRSKVETRRFSPGDEVRVLRPGPIDPCECGVGR